MGLKWVARGLVPSAPSWLRSRRCIALIYFRRQASVMTKQLQEAQKEQERQQKTAVEQAQMTR